MSANSPSPPADSARKRELLDAAYSWVLEHGWAGLSLRPLAEAIGSSAGVLLFLFGSKDGLIRALLERSRAEQVALLEGVRSDEAADLATATAQVWGWLSAPKRRPLLRLWLEAYSRSVGDVAGPWQGFAAQTVADWDGLLAAHQPARRRASATGAAERSLVLAVLRGGLLDLLATGDEARVGRAVGLHVEALRTAR
ncbi:MAG TPA: TetR/AcrR family transcriptional regulator [Frankiaceae bacterium]|nr:TetR/AcrR family transcriptional regulator [Frankiaceae bacterium]